MSGDVKARLGRLATAAFWLQLLSGLCFVSVAGLIAFRVGSIQPPAPPAPAVYAPMTEPKPKPPPPRAQKGDIGDVTETERPGTGFIVVVESMPDAVLSIDGIEDGPTPASHNFDCAPGKTYRLALKHPGYAAAEHTITCKKDVMLVVEARLEPLKRR